MSPCHTCDIDVTVSRPVIPLATDDDELVAKLREAAKGGNTEAIKALQSIRREIRFKELVNNMDDDEFTP